MEKNKEKKGLSGCSIALIFIVIGMCSSVEFFKIVGSIVLIVLAIICVFVVFALPFLNNIDEGE